MAASIIAAAVRVCTRCGAAKPADAAHFNREPRAPSGLTATCKSCRYAIRRASNWPSDAAVVAAARSRERRKGNIDEERRRNRERMQRVYREKPELWRAYAAANREKIADYYRKKY